MAEKAVERGLKEVKVILAPVKKLILANSKVLTLPGGVGVHVAVPVSAPFSAFLHLSESHLPVHVPWVPSPHL